MNPTSQPSSAQKPQSINRQDAFARCIGILDQMGEGWPMSDCVRKSVNRVAVMLRDTEAPIHTLIEYAQTMRRTYAPESKGWAIMGCLENILRGGNQAGILAQVVAPESAPSRYWASNERCWVQIVKPRQTIMGNWLLCRNEQGAEWFIPFSELRATQP